MIKNPRQTHSSAWICCLLGSLLLGTGAVLALEQEQAPKSFRLEEKALQNLSNQEMSDKGQFALSIKPEKWKHAETDNFIFHYRRITEAQRVVNEIEYHLWFISKFLGATKDQYQHKSHVFVFKDLDEWKIFRGQAGKEQWAASFAYRGDLFLNFRDETPGGFDSQLLAHETSHVVVRRLYPGKHWPIWLNEGFAECMGGASVAARKGFSASHYQQKLSKAYMPLDKLTAITEYPKDRSEVHELYQSSERLIRFLINDFPKDRFPSFVTAVLDGQGFEPALLSVYGDHLKNREAFDRRFDRFVK